MLEPFDDLSAMLCEQAENGVTATVSCGDNDLELFVVCSPSAYCVEVEKLPDIIGLQFNQCKAAFVDACATTTYPFSMSK
jgi:hypothetical protein